MYCVRNIPFRPKGGGPHPYTQVKFSFNMSAQRCVVHHVIPPPFLLSLGYNTAAETVKVPPMAESISEGTLRTWSKQVGDFVAADEEVATIETDKVFLFLFNVFA